MALADRIVELLEIAPGVTDREITDRLFSTSTHPSQVNQTCRLLEDRGLLVRKQKPDGRIGNFLSESPPAPFTPRQSGLSASEGLLSEDMVKKVLEAWLVADGWNVEIAWGKVRGVDVLATRGKERWIIEAKGCGSLSPMRVNYFLSVIGETLQRMHDENARYSIALPDMRQFRRLWERLPPLAKSRTGISALFVGLDGQVEVIC